MKKKLVLLVIVFVCAVVASGQSDDKRIEAIRSIYADTNSAIAEMSKQPELSSVFAVELTVNKHSAPYPAVGVYQRTTTFFYTYGDREKNPYPDRLLKIAATYKRSSRVENIEFYFSPVGQLVFAFASNPESAIKETRMHFSTGKLIKMTDDGKEIGLKSRRAVEAGTLAAREAARLKSLFQIALIDND